METSLALPVLNPADIPQTDIDSNQLAEYAKLTTDYGEDRPTSPGLAINYKPGIDTVPYGAWVYGQTFVDGALDNPGVCPGDAEPVITILAVRCGYVYEKLAFEEDGVTPLVDNNDEQKTVFRSTHQFHNFFQEEAQSCRREALHVPHIIPETLKGIIYCYCLLHDGHHKPAMIKFKGTNYKVFDSYIRKLTRAHLPYYSVLTTLGKPKPRSEDGKDWFEIDSITQSDVLQKSYVDAYHAEAVKTGAAIDEFYASTDTPRAGDISTMTVQESNEMDIETTVEADVSGTAQAAIPNTAQAAIPNTAQAAIPVGTTKTEQDRTSINANKNAVINYGKGKNLSSAQIKQIVTNSGLVFDDTLTEANVLTIKSAIDAFVNAITSPDPVNDVPF